LNVSLLFLFWKQINLGITLYLFLLTERKPVNLQIKSVPLYFKFIKSIFAEQDTSAQVEEHWLSDLNTWQVNHNLTVRACQLHGCGADWDWYTCVHVGAGMLLAALSLQSSNARIHCLQYSTKFMSFQRYLVENPLHIGYVWK
jgi:hypothetical protein